jgi:hypothetical protein
MSILTLHPHSQLMKTEAVDDHHGKQRQEAHEAFNPG